jgi:hypothetical protein
MAFTVSEFQDLTQILYEHPEWRAEMRRLVLTDELLALPDMVRELVAAQQRTEQRLDRLSIAVIDLKDSQQRTEQRLEHWEDGQKRSEQRLERLEEGQARHEQRFDRLDESFARLAAAQAHLDEKMVELAATQSRTDERMAELREAQLRTDEKMTELREAQLRTDEKMTGIREAQLRTDEKTTELREAQLRTDGTIARLLAGQDKLIQEMIKFERVQQALITDVRKLQGGELEHRYIQYAPGYFGAILRRVRVLWPGALDPEMEDRLDEHLTPEERSDVLRLDAIIRGQLRNMADRSDVYLALEASKTIEPNDVVRARQRAALLRKTGLRTLPVVAGESITQETVDMIEKLPAVIVMNGHSEGWAEALATT